MLDWGMENTAHLPQTEVYAHLVAIIASSDDAIISKDLNGNIKSWNPAAERIFGYKAEEAIGRHISLIIPQESLSEEDYILGEIKQGNKVDHFETRRRNKSGNLVDISVTVSPIRNAEGVIIGASKVARDVTLIKEAEKASAYLGAIIESSDDAIISKDLNGFITSWNKSAERIFGYRADEIIGRHVTTIIPAERLKEEDKILTTLQTGDRVDHFETIRRHKDGHLIPVSLTVSPIRDSSGKIVGASKISRDISERVRAEQALIEVSQKKDEFLANMSHELRTPLNVVIGIANLLKSMSDLPPKAVKYIDTLKTSGDNLLNLINDLLDFARLESGLIQIEKIDFDLVELVSNVESLSTVKAQEKGLSLHVEIDPSLHRHFIGDPLRIQQVLTNLISNAVKFTETGSVRLAVQGTYTGGSETTAVTFKISDTGIGIAKDKLDTIFEKFTQADASITRKYGGSGLGLAISKECTTQMHGSIEAQSDIGIGTTFIVTLPLGNTDKASSVEKAAADTGIIPLAVRKHVLLVEDFEPNILVAGEMLESLGYDYDVAKNGFEALKKFSSGQFDVILMDLQMAEMDGIEATRRIRKAEAERGVERTPVIAMTAHVREQDKDLCLEAGMDDFLSKPYDFKTLSQKVSQYVPLDDAKTGS